MHASYIQPSRWNWPLSPARSFDFTCKNDMMREYNVMFLHNSQLCNNKATTVCLGHRSTKFMMVSWKRVIDISQSLKM